MAIHVFSCLKSQSNSQLIFDPMELRVGYSIFAQCNWCDFYARAVEMTLPNIPNPPIGMRAMLWMFVDINHAGDKVS